MSAIIYPAARWEPLSEHSAPGTLADRNTIVLHITQGSTAEGAIATFRASVHPNRVSAHFVIDRDGTVHQLVDINDTAWHASQVNSHSVGIEHVAMAAAGQAAGMPATDAQYRASSALIKWLAGQMNIPIDRNHIRAHNEASPRDGHVLCCTGALDPDKLVGLAAT
jgi:N-acetyl-anhydromuramyl-L-alanine amidase AmpD